MCFFHFFKILIFQVVRRVKGQKMAKNDKKLSAVPYISGTIHHMIFIYGTPVWCTIYGAHFFQVLIFGVGSGVKGQKMAQNDKKLCLSHSISQKHTSYDCDFWNACVK